MGSNYDREIFFMEQDIEMKNRIYRLKHRYQTCPACKESGDCEIQGKIIYQKRIQKLNIKCPKCNHVWLHKEAKDIW